MSDQIPASFLHLVLPGFGNSGPGHWQTLWEAADPAFRRVHLGDWEAPAREAWVTRLESAIASTPAPTPLLEPSVVLVAHSLACLMVAHWAASAPPTSLARVRASFLAAPVDPASPAFPASARGFAPVPAARLPFPSLVLASSDDPFASFAWQQERARDWGSSFTALGRVGHINAASGLEEWPEGIRLLGRLLESLPEG